MIPTSGAVEARRSLAWDASHGPRNYLTLVGAHLVGSVAAFAATWLATRLVGVTGYGIVAAVLAASQGIMQVTLHWSAPSLARFGCVEFVTTGRVATAFWTRLMILGPNLALVVLTAAWWLPPVGRWLTIPPDTIGLVLGHCAVMALWIHVQQGLLAAKSPSVLGVLMASERVTIVAVLLLLAGAASTFGVVLAYIIGPLSMAVIGLWVLRAVVFAPARVDRAGVKQMLTFSMPLIPKWVLGYVSTNALDALFITHFLSVRDLGIYWVAYQVTGVFIQLALLGGTLMLPVFVTLHLEGREQETRRILCDVLPLASLLWTALCAASAAAAGSLVPIVFGPDYAFAGLLVWPLMAAGALAGPALMGYSPYLNAVSATLTLSLVACVGAITNVALNALLIPPLGLLGCAWATTAAYAAATLAITYAVQRRWPAAGHRALEGSVPMVLGAAFASWSGQHLGALLVAWLGCALLIGLRHRSVVDGVRAIEAAGLLRPLRNLLTMRPRSGGS
jgi:O-antigen/teichoic acid export membrane protein